MATTSTVRNWWSDWWKCSPPEFAFMGLDHPRFTEEVHEAVRASEHALRANGYDDAVHVSTYYPRPIGGYTCNMAVGGSGCSLHGYGICFDLDAPLNPYYRRPIDEAIWARIKLTKAQVAAVEAIRTNNGKQVWKWLGWSIGDTMHFQINCSPADLATGINWDTVPDYDSGNPPMEDEPMITKGHPVEEVVVEIQQGLIAWDSNALPLWGDDGDYGNETAEWVGKYQVAQGVPATGAVDGLTHSMLVKGEGGAGTVGPAGPAGPAGPKGATGPAGQDGTVEVFVDGIEVA